MPPNKLRQNHGQLMHSGMSSGCQPFTHGHPGWCRKCKAARARSSPSAQHPGMRMWWTTWWVPWKPLMETTDGIWWSLHRLMKNDKIWISLSQSLFCLVQVWQGWSWGDPEKGIKKVASLPQSSQSQRHGVEVSLQFASQCLAAQSWLCPEMSWDVLSLQTLHVGSLGPDDTASHLRRQDVCNFRKLCCDEGHLSPFHLLSFHAIGKVDSTMETSKYDHLRVQHTQRIQQIPQVIQLPKRSQSLPGSLCHSQCRWWSGRCTCQF